jgi:hypothetical protein
MKRFAARGLATIALMAGLAGGAARADDFDGRKAQDALSVVTHNGASGEVKKDKEGRAYIDGQTGQLFFQGSYYDCEHKEACKVFMLASSWDTTDVTADQVNGWNRWTLSCPAYLDGDGTPNMWSAMTIYATQTRDQFAADFRNFQACLTDFDDFVGDPEGFLKKNLDGYTPPAAPAAPASPAAGPKSPVEKL